MDLVLCFYSEGVGNQKNENQFDIKIGQPYLKITEEKISNGIGVRSLMDNRLILSAKGSIQEDFNR